MITIKECHKRLSKEMDRRFGKDERPISEATPEKILAEIKLMQKVLDDNPNWGYKIIFQDDDAFMLISRQ